MEKDDQSPVCEDLIPGSEKLYLFFGGIAGGIGMPPFEFYRASRILHYSRVFLRDQNQSWYQRGLPSIGNDIYAIGDFLRAIISRSGASQITFVGNSMGGFAALLFCSMLQRGKAIVFAPQVFIDAEKRSRHGDRRWAAQINELHRTRSRSDIYDLKPWIERRFPEMSASVYVSSADALDMRHADELMGFPYVEIHPFPDAGHGLVAKLRRDGALEKILTS